MSLSQPCFSGESLLGIVGMDVYQGDLMEAVNYFGNGDGGRSMGNSAGEYAFLTDMNGITLSHPALGRPLGLNYDQGPTANTDISHLEPYEGFKNITEKMLKLVHWMGISN